MNGRRLTLVALLGFALGAATLAAGLRVREHFTRVIWMAGAPPLDASLHARRVSQFAASKATPRIVMLGDSRVQEAEWNELLGRTDVVNRGIAGDTTSGLFARLGQSVPPSAAVCVIQVGYNDLLQQNPLDQVEQNFRAILGKLAASERPPRVLLTPVILSGDASGSLNARIAAVNSTLRQIATERHAGWLDLNEKLCPHGSLDRAWTNDRAHLNGAAYEIIAAALKPRLTELAPSSPASTE